MVTSGSHSAEIASTSGLFITTHWSVVLSSQQTGSAQGEAALARLCETYWYPLYCFVRRQGQSPSDAQDLVQGFFAKLLEKDYLQNADPEKGRLRSFLLLAMKRFMANEWDKANRQKRGGGSDVVSINIEDTEVRYRAEPTDEMSPERIYDRQWAIGLLEQVLGQLENECVAAGNGEAFSELKIFLTGEKSDRPYAEIARKLGVAEGTLRGTVFRLRQRYREILTSKIADTVETTEGIDDEIRHLFAALA